MTRGSLENVGKAALDKTFRHALFSDPDETLADFTLTKAEIQALKAINSEALKYCELSGYVDGAIAARTTSFKWGPCVG